eukprot:g17141.t1
MAEAAHIPPGTILITGAYGFLGTHCIQQAVQRGYRVRATVRGFGMRDALLSALGNADASFAADRVTLVKLDLDSSSQAEWDEAARGCDYCLHLATPVVTTYVQDPESVIRPAVEGTEKVLRACAKTRVKRVVFCSSTSAINAGHARSKTHFDHRDWNAESPGADSKKVFVYERSKSLAEKAAWRLSTELGVPLVAVLPGSIWGPTILPRLSPCGEAVKRIAEREVPFLPRLCFNCVDVRDVAMVHLKALEAEAAVGKRLLAVAPEPFYALFLERAAFILPNVERAYTYDVRLTQEVLGLKEFRSVKKAVVEMADSYRKMKMLDESRKNLLVAAVKMICPATHFHIGSPDGSPVNREDLDALDAEYDALNSSMSHMGSDPEVRSRDLLSEEDQIARKGDGASASAHSGAEDFIRDIPSPQKKRRQSANSALARLSSTSSSGSMENRSRAVAYPRPDDIYPPRDSVTGARAYAFGSRPTTAVSGHLRAEAEFSAEEDEPRLDERTAEEERVVGPASGGTDTDTQVFPDGAVEVGKEYDFDAGAEFTFSAEEDELRLDERTAEEDQAPAGPEPEFSAEEDELRLDERTDEDEEDIWRDACLADMPVARSQCETSSPMNVDVAQNASSVEVGAGMGDGQPSPCDREIADDPHIIYFDGELGGEGDTATESEALSDTKSGTPYQAPSAAALAQQSVAAGMELSRISEASCESNKVEYGSSPGDGSEGSSCGARTPVGGAADAKKSAARRSASDGVVDESDAEQDGARFLHIPFPSSANNCTSEAAQQFSGMERVPLVNDAVDADTLENKSVEAAILHLSCQEELSRVVSHVLSLSGEEDVCDAVGASPLPPVSMGSDADAKSLPLLQDETPENRTRRDAGLLSPERMSLEDLPAGPSSVRRDMSKVDSLTKLAEAAATLELQLPATATVSDDIKTTAFRSDLGRFKFDISPEGEDVPLGEALDRLMRRREEMRFASLLRILLL